MPSSGFERLLSIAGMILVAAREDAECLTNISMKWCSWNAVQLVSREAEQYNL